MSDPEMSFLLIALSKRKSISSLILNIASPCRENIPIGTGTKAVWKGPHLDPHLSK